MHFGITEKPTTDYASLVAVDFRLCGLLLYCSAIFSLFYFVLFYILYCIVILYQFSVDYLGTC